MARHNAVLRGGDCDNTTFAAFGPFTIEVGPPGGLVSVYVPTDQHENRGGRRLQVYAYTGKRTQP